MIITILRQREMFYCYSSLAKKREKIGEKTTGLELTKNDEELQGCQK